MMFQLRSHQQRGLDAMESFSKGILLMPTGAGKTLTMIFDTIRQFSQQQSQTVVVVCPRILLAEQLSSEFLEFITNAHVIHIHSGETRHFSTTKPNVIRAWHNAVEGHKLIFTTYNSLQKLQMSDIDIDLILFDEAHNSVRRDFFPAVEYFASESNRAYFFTATPKHSVTVSKPGMNDAAIYGNVICNVPAPELVDQGYILPPKVVVKQLEMVQDKQIVADRDSNNLLESIDENNLNKILICARSTKQIINLISQSDFCSNLKERGYSWMYITSKTGAVIDGQKVNREVFFDTLNAWGQDESKKFVVIHHSILSEGINVSGLEAVLFMRNMDFIGISQTIGRVVRLGGAQKTFGLVVVPVFDKVGVSTAKSVQAVVDTVFRQGLPAISIVRR